MVFFYIEAAHMASQMTLAGQDKTNDKITAGPGTFTLSGQAFFNSVVIEDNGNRL